MSYGIGNSLPLTQAQGPAGAGNGTSNAARDFMSNVDPQQIIGFIMQIFQMLASLSG